jgi:hypothetical protein
MTRSRRIEAWKVKDPMTRRFSACLSCAAALTLWCGTRDVLADDTLIVTAPGPTTTAPVEPPGTLPNRFLLRSGVFTLGAAYVPALVVAVESDRAADNHLYAPIVGPWFDLAARDECRGDCGGETVNKVLLVTDGIFQGLGALQILGAFVMPETRTLALRNSDGSRALSLKVLPASFGRGANGLLAVGNF